MKEKRDKKGRKWRLVEPAYPVEVSVASLSVREIKSYLTRHCEVLDVRLGTLSTGEIVAFIVYRRPDGRVSYSFAVPEPLSAQGVKEVEKLFEEFYEYWLNRASQGAPRGDVGLPLNV